MLFCVCRNSDLTHCTQHGSRNSESAGNRCDDCGQGNGCGDDRGTNRGEHQPDVPQLLKE